MFAPLAVSDVDDPVQIEGAEGVTVTVGNALTVTVTVLVFTHPVVVLVPVTVYVVVVVGFALTAAPVVALNAVAGVHE